MADHDRIRFGFGSVQPSSRSSFEDRLDGAGVAWSTLCALYCAIPLVLVGVALVAGGAHAHAHHGHEMHRGFPLLLALSSVVVAAILLGRRYASRHRDWRPLGIFGVAPAVLAVSALVPWSSEAAGMIANVVGFAGLVGAQIMNGALVRRSSACCDEGCCC